VDDRFVLQFDGAGRVHGNQSIIMREPH
jgi:hypothetical protein